MCAVTRSVFVRNACRPAAPFIPGNSPLQDSGIAATCRHSVSFDVFASRSHFALALLDRPRPRSGHGRPASERSRRCSVDVVVSEEAIMRSSTSGIRHGLVIPFILIAFLVSLTTNVPSAAAGQGSGASIIGQVTDQSGAVLPGVTVTATSPALQVPQVTAVTNEVGEYRLAPLPIGVFEVAFELSGFRPIQRQNVRLTVGFTARIDVGLELATVAETVTVSGAAPVVDVASTSGSTLLTKEMLEVAATSRNTLSFLTMAPGVRSLLDVGGNQLVETRAFARVRAGRQYVVTRSRASPAPRPCGTRKRSTRRGPEPRHRCGVLAARRAAQRRREVRRERLPRRRVLGPDEPPFPEQQHRRRAGGAGHRERQLPRRTSTTSAGTWVAASCGTSCGSTGRHGSAATDITCWTRSSRMGRPSRMATRRSITRRRSRIS